MWSSEPSRVEDASKERESLLSKPTIYYLLNRYALSAQHVIMSINYVMLNWYLLVMRALL